MRQKPWSTYRWQLWLNSDRASIFRNMRLESQTLHAMRQVDESWRKEHNWDIPVPTPFRDDGETYSWAEMEAREETSRVWSTRQLILDAKSQEPVKKNENIAFFIRQSHKYLPLRRVIAIPEERNPLAASLTNLEHKILENLSVFKYFITLTFDEQHLELLDKQYASDFMKSHLNRLRNTYPKWRNSLALYCLQRGDWSAYAWVLSHQTLRNRDLTLLWRFELGDKNDRPHFHILCSGYMPAVVWYRFWSVDPFRMVSKKGEKPKFTGTEPIGMIKMLTIKTKEQLMRYVSKYMAKDSQRWETYAMLTRRLWGASQGLKCWQPRWSRDVYLENSEEFTAASAETFRFFSQIDNIKRYYRDRKLHDINYSLNSIGVFKDECLRQIFYAVAERELTEIEINYLIHWKKTFIPFNLLPDVFPSHCWGIQDSMNKFRKRKINNNRLNDVRHTFFENNDGSFEVDKPDPLGTICSVQEYRALSSQPCDRNP